MDVESVLGIAPPSFLSSAPAAPDDVLKMNTSHYDCIVLISNSERISATNKNPPDTLTIWGVLARLDEISCSDQVIDGYL